MITELMDMVVYADILFLLNFLVDYFLLAICEKFTGSALPAIRTVAGALLGAAGSLTLFLPPMPTALEILLRAGICSAVTLVVFGFKSIKCFLRNAVTFFAVTCSYTGVMLALWYIAKPHGMVIKNSVVYFNISPLFLIVFSVAGYFSAVICRHFLAKDAPCAEKCRVKLFYGENQTEYPALIDSGNSLADAFGNSEIIVADELFAAELLGDYKTDRSLETRYRAVPCRTVAGSELLDGYRCDKAYITCGGRTTELYRPILAVSKAPIGEECHAIINPRTIEQ